MQRLGRQLLFATSKRAVNARNPIIFPNFIYPIARFASKKKGDKKKDATSDEVPDNFYNSEVEKDKEALDVLSSLSYKDGSFARLDDLAINDRTITWDQVHEARDSPLQPLPDLTPEEEEKLAEETLKSLRLMAENGDEDGLTASDEMVLERFTAYDVGQKEGLKEDGATAVEEDEYISVTHSGIDYPPDLFDINADSSELKEEFSTSTWTESGGELTAEDKMEDLLDEFTPNDTPGKFSPTEEGRAPCPGHRQRKGKLGKLQCHKIDLDALHFMNVVTLSNYLTEDAEIMGRKDTGLCAKCQRKVAKSIKQARHFGVLPHLGDYDMHEVETDDRSREQFHRLLPKGEQKKYFKSSLRKIGV